MRCNHCGSENRRDEKTCPNCGTSLGVKYNLDEIDFIFDDTSESPNRQVYHNENPYVPISQKSFFALPLKVDDVMNAVLFSLDGEIVHTIETDQINLQSYSLSHEVVALTVGSEQKLYVVTGKDQNVLDTDVDSILVSQDGTNVAYIKGVKDNTGELYLYDVKSKKTRKLTSMVSAQNYMLSPDGDSIMYNKWQEVGVQQELYVSVDKKEPEKIASWETPVGISNHGKFLYVMGEDELYVKTGGEKIRLGDKLNLIEVRIMFNLDHTQVIYYEDGITYICIEGKKKKLTDGMINHVVLSPDAGYDWDNSGVINFTNHVIQKDDGFYYINDKYELNYICKNSDYFQTANDMKSILMNENHELYLYKNYENNSVIKKRIGDANNIMRISASSDLSIIYYLNDKNELYSIKEDGMPIKIAENVSYEFTYNYIDGFCYYKTNSDEDYFGDLYYTVNQEKGKKVKNLERGAMGSMISGGVLGAHPTDDNKMDLYVLIDGEAKLILTNASKSQ